MIRSKYKYEQEGDFVPYRTFAEILSDLQSEEELSMLEGKNSDYQFSGSEEKFDSDTPAFGLIWASPFDGARGEQNPAFSDIRSRLGLDIDMNPIAPSTE